MSGVNTQVAFVGPDGRLTLGGYEMLSNLEQMLPAIAALQAKLTAIAAVSAPTGGTTVDTQARAAINAIRTAAG